MSMPPSALPTRLKGVAPEVEALGEGRHAVPAAATAGAVAGGHGEGRHGHEVAALGAGGGGSSRRRHVEKCLDAAGSMGF